MIYPVLMADIRGSRKRSGVTLIKHFHELVYSANKRHKQVILSPLTITLGDEFQGVMKDVQSALKVIIAIEEQIIQKQFDLKLRYALNIGRIETELNRKIAHEMLGSGLTNARESLNRLKKEDRRFIFQSRKPKFDSQINNAFIIFQSIVDDWKLKDYYAIREFIANTDYKELAEMMSVNPTTAWRKKRSLKIKEYNAIKELILSLDQ